MEYRILENNQVEISGAIVSPLEFNHEVFGEAFYKFYLSSMRESGVYDVLPVIISENLIDVSQKYDNVVVKIHGDYRSHNNNHKLELNVFARELEFLQDADMDDVNRIHLDGFICKKPVHRKTPKGRVITDILLAVNRPYGKSDYIPCVFWGRNAIFTSHLSVGHRISLDGRIQSREYDKKLDEDNVEHRIAYEVSACRVFLEEEVE